MNKCFNFLKSPARKPTDNLFFLSETNMDGQILTPRIPRNFFTDNGFEDNKTRRVCFAPSIDKCLLGLSMNCKNKEYFVHVPIGSFAVIYPTKIDVPDVEITGEIWVCDPVKIECVGKIRVDDRNGLVYKYTYGDNINDVLFGWNWHYIV
jgi:hypothetical protein